MRWDTRPASGSVSPRMRSCARIGLWRSSSVVEQGTHKPLVGGSNPPSATNLDRNDAALPIRRAVSNSFISGAPPSGRPDVRTAVHETQDLRHGVVTALDAILARTGDARSSPARPRRLLLNPKFFRNGIVMLVLVVGTAALLFTWIQGHDADQPGRLLAVPHRRPARQGRHGRPAGRHAHRQAQGRHRPTYTVTVPSVLTQVYPTTCSRPPRPAARTLAPDIYKAEPAPDTSWLGLLLTAAPAAARDRRLHLLHDAPGPGHQ